MENGCLPTTGTHKDNDIDPHDTYGDKYIHIASDIYKQTDSFENIIILIDTDNLIISYIYNISVIIGIISVIILMIRKFHK